MLSENLCFPDLACIGLVDSGLPKMINENFNNVNKMKSLKYFQCTGDSA